MKRNMDFQEGNSDHSISVSVIIITYNHEKYIAQAIDSVLTQICNFNIEIVIGEDSSTDLTAKIVQSYKERYPNIITVITSDSNVGMIDNFIRTFNACKGKYIAICEGDDYWTDSFKLQKQVSFLEAHSDYSLCVHDVKTVFEGVPEIDPFSIQWEKPVFTFEDAVVEHFVPTLSILLRRECLNILPNWFSDCMVGDRPLVLLLLLQGNGYYLHDVMGVKRKNLGGITSKKGRKNTRNLESLRMYHNINSISDKKYKILHKKIASLEWAIGITRVKKMNIIQGISFILHSMKHDRCILKKKLFKRSFYTCE